MKREPTLADRLLATRGDPRVPLDHKYYDRALDNLTLAKKFVLDGQAASYVGTLLREHPRIVADAQDFAQRPFESMWVEMPFPSFFQAVTGRTQDALADKRVGYLFEGPRVMVGAQGCSDTGIENATLMPVEYVLNKPMTLQQQLDFCQKLGCSRIGLDAWFWGESALSLANPSARFKYRPDGYYSDDGSWDNEAMRSLRDNHTARLTPMHPLVRADADKFAKILDGSGGDLRNIIALLLFLNRTQDIQFVRDVPRGSGFIRSKLRPYAPHRVISLKLDPMPRMLSLVAGLGVKRRLHDVRGHYKHDKKARAGCKHGIELQGDFGEWWREYEPLRWTCEECGGKRWWQPEHSRGSIDEGVVASSYAVTR